MDPFVAEIRIVGFNFAPKGWAFCNGQLMPISQNTALFSLLGTIYGGDGKSTFALPNLQGNAPMHWGQGPGLSNRGIGEAGGAPTVTLVQAQMPVHTHQAQANASGNNRLSPTGNAWSSLGTTRTPPPLYSNTQNTQMSPAALADAGGSQPHNNRSPYLCLNFIIALQGVFPPRS